MTGRGTPAGERVVITDADFDRLNQLTQSRRYRATHSALLADLKGELDAGDVVAPSNVQRWVVTMKSRVRSSSASAVPSLARATTRRPRPSRSTAWWWNEFTLVRFGWSSA